MTLYPYQKVGAEFLASRKAALLADEMGLGKTVQAIAACDSLLAAEVLVVCPASVVENWKREFARFSVTGIRPTVLSYDVARRGQFFDHVDVLILDEAHYLKSADSKRTQAVLGPNGEGRGLVDLADRVFLLTGTPMPNNPAELWSLLRACAPETIPGKSGKSYSYWQFVNKYCVTRDNGFGLQIVGGKNHDKLKAALEPFMLRRLKVDVLPDLPDIRYDQLFVEGKVAQSAEYSAEVEKVERALAKGVDGLREIAPHVATLRRLTGLAKVAGVVEWVKDWLDGGGGKIVLFAHHREVLDALQTALAGVGTATVRGDTTDRQRVVDRFQNDPSVRVFIGQLQAAGTGVTLTAASDVLFVESSWVPAENQQAAMRVHRIGQKDACMVRFATLAGSIDEQIQRAVARKVSDIEKIVG